MSNIDIEEYLEMKIGLDDTFRFKCRECGRCCKNREDILLNAKDIFNIAKKLSMNPEETIHNFTEVYIGSSSNIPVVRLLPVGSLKSCPFLKQGRCIVHDCKPVVCALFPLGRYAVNEELTGKDGELELGYLLQPVNCGSLKKRQTVRQWLEVFNIPIEDPFYKLWSKTITKLSASIRRWKNKGISPSAIEKLNTYIYYLLYVDYDIEKNFFEQFTHNINKLDETLNALEKIPAQ